MNQEAPPRPSQLVISVGGFMGPSYELRLDGEALFYRAAPGAYQWGAPERIEPSEDRWRAFARALDRERLWEWSAEYPNRGMLDGTGWSVSITWGGRSVETRGVNGYPSDADPTVPSDDRFGNESQRFLRFVRAVRRLLGRRFR